ncbi:D-alanyl-D-alanine carboxypeptidase, partial [Salmonella enterica subsp. enterica serovar Kentucky]|nr:D-alanyl-D-alanine carboxypeptidase [Salmonella enterica subsp. enterica serovar Kentucky]
MLKKSDNMIADTVFRMIGHVRFNVPGTRVDSGLTPLNSYENRVYQFQDEDRRRFVVKFYRPERWSVDQI